MVKLSWKPPFFLREQAKAIIAETSKGLFSREPFAPPKDISDYYEYYETDSVVASAVDSLADAAVGRGFDTEVEEDDEAKELVDELCKQLNLDLMVPNIARNILVAGFLPVETFITSEPEKCILQLIHPKTVEKLEWDKDHIHPTTLIQKVGMKRAELQFDKLTWFTYKKVGNDPFGTSLIKRIVTLLGYKHSATDRMDAVLERYGSPKAIWKSRGNIKPIMDAVMEAGKGEDVFLGNLPDEALDKIVEFLDIDVRVAFWEYIQYFDQLIYTGLMAPSIFYFRDATEASARVLLEIVDRNIFSLGRCIKREIENKWFKPFVELNDHEEVPKIKWRQRPAMKDLHLPDLVGAGLDKGFIGFEAYHELMGNLGITWEKSIEDMKVEYELRRQQVFPQKPSETPRETPFPLAHSMQETGPAYLVTPVTRRKRNVFNELLHLTYEECVPEAKSQGIDDPEGFCKFLAQKNLLEKKHERSTDHSHASDKSG